MRGLRYLLLAGVALGCGAPEPEVHVYCEAVHADGRGFSCAGAREHESVFPTRWWLEVDATGERAPVWLGSLALTFDDDSRCRVEREPSCAHGRCAVVLRQDAHGVCSARLELTSDEGPLSACFASHRSADETSEREDARAARRACN